MRKKRNISFFSVNGITKNRTEHRPILLTDFSPEGFSDPILSATLSTGKEDEA